MSSDKAGHGCEEFYTPEAYRGGRRVRAMLAVYVQRMLPYWLEAQICNLELDRPRTTN